MRRVPGAEKPWRIFSVNADFDSPFSLRGLDHYADRLAAVPFERIGFAGGLTDKCFPGEICCNMRVAVAGLAHPADNGVRINADGVAVIQIA